MAVMRGAVFAVLLFSIPALAADHPTLRVFTVSELEQTLTEARAGHRSDLEIAQELDSIELSERLTDTEFVRLQALLDPNSQSATALQLVADQSIFFKPSPNELTDTSVPDSKARMQILTATVDYVSKLFSTLPNLLATRTTTSYSNISEGRKKGETIVSADLHKIKTISLETSIRNDEIDVSNKDPRLKHRKEDMNSRGEFGALLAVILSDTRSGKVFWNYWEPSLTGKLAVFGFEVPKSASHYTFDDAHRIDHPAYHGSLWIEPASGAVDRLFLEVEPDAEMSVHFGTMVQYGPVKIDDKTFLCPVRSVAIEKAAAFRDDLMRSAPSQPLGKWLNETTFTNYHRFASTAQIITAPNQPK